MATDFSNWLFGGTKSREHKDTLSLYREVEGYAKNSPFTNESFRRKFLFELILDSCEDRRVRPVESVGGALWHLVETLLDQEGFLPRLPPVESLESLSMEDGVALRERLRRLRSVLQNSDTLLLKWREKMVRVLSLILSRFPLAAFEDVEEVDGERSNAILFPEADAYALLDNLAECIELAFIGFYDDEIFAHEWFLPLRQHIDGNIMRASGLKPPFREEMYPKMVVPSRSKEKDPVALLHEYLGGTPLHGIFEAKVPFAIPFPARFEHTHILAGSGHGKTQLLQFMVHHDLVKALDDGRSVVVMDGQGDLIRTISHLSLFGSSQEQNLADRFVLVDPTDIEYPVAFNMFDFDRARMSGFATAEREMILNATVETYEYFFGALLGAELTQRQGVIFRYIARLMMEIPDATIHTLLELMLNGEKYRPYMDKLTGTAKVFFQTQFFDRQFSENKKQIVARLWGVLSNTTLERMFSHPKNKLDLFTLTQQGKIILVNTAKDFLGHEGSVIFGRFIVSLIAQAAIQRAVLPAHERTPTFCYIDEAADYFDSSIERLVNQARKYKIGMVFSHQNLDQLSPALRASILASTSIKFVGGLSSKDANALDSELRTDAEFLLAQKKRREHTEFACYVKNYSPRAVSVQIPLGYVEGQPTLEDWEHEELVEANREQYGVSPVVPDLDLASSPPKRRESAKSHEKPPEPAPVSEVAPEVLPETQEDRRMMPEPKPVLEAAETPEAPIPVEEVPESIQTPQPVLRAKASVPRYTPKEPGGGGRQHRYLAHLVKQLAEERGYRAALEEEILEGAGRVDVVLSRGERRVAVEISVTTGRDWELQNVEKCLSAGFPEVLVVSTNERHLKSLSRFIPGQLDEEARERVRFLSAEDFVGYLDKDATPAATEKTVRGYKVRVTSAALSEEEAEERRSAIAEVIARSMLRGKE